MTQIIPAGKKKPGETIRQRNYTCEFFLQEPSRPEGIKERRLGTKQGRSNVGGRKRSCRGFCKTGDCEIPLILSNMRKSKRGVVI